MLKIRLPFKIYKLQGKLSREFLVLKSRSFQVFI